MLQLKSVDFRKEKVETLIIPVCEDKEIHQEKTIKALIKKAQALEEFKGAAKDGVTFYSSGWGSLKR